MAGITQRLKVKLKGGGPWGFRLLGGAGTGLPLTVAKVRRKSKSYKNLQDGDLFIKVNDVPCNNLTYEQVMCIADKSGDELHLEIERKSHATEDNSTSFPSMKDYQQQTTPTKNVAKYFQEEKTSVTDRIQMDGIKSSSSITDINQDIISSQRSPFEEISTKSELEKNEDEFISKETLLHKPTLSMDITSKTTAEISPTCEKFEEVQTEKFHEKLENKETTIIRTDYEEVIKKNSHDASIPTTIPLIVIPSEETSTEAENLNQGIPIVQSYECSTSETEVTTTTTKVNGYSSQFDNDQSKTPETVAVGLPKSTNILGSDTVVKSSDTTTTLETTESFSTWDKEFDASMIKKKKMFSSSSFYEEPQAIYPTMEEQVEMAKKIAESLADDTNKKSKGANMFYKRAKRSTKWIHEGPEPFDNIEPATPDAAPEPFYPEYYVDTNQKRSNGPKLKLVLDPRHPIDAASLRSTGHKISEHNVVSPEVCHGLVRDLESPKGKGSALFAKRKKKSSEWVVDEEKVKSLMKSQEKNLEQLKQNMAQDNVTSLRSPYNTFELPYKRYDFKINRVNPEKLAETVIQAAEFKRRDSIQSLEEPHYETCMSPIVPATPAASYYDIYKAKAPTGWSSPSVTMNPDFGTPSAVTEISDQLPYYLSALPTVTNKYQFQNFNTLPRKWKSPY